MGDLLNRVKEQESNTVRAQKLKEKKTIVSQIAGSKEQKNKQISVKVNDRTYENFKAINKMKGISCNSKINELISDYVRANRDCIND